MQLTDRYEALGIPHPDPATMCQGQCEGTGVVPIYMSKGNHRDQTNAAVPVAEESAPAFVDAWERAEAEKPTEDGWHFVKCPDCNGTGKK